MPSSEAQDALRIKEDRPSPGRQPEGFGWSGKTRFGGFFVAYENWRAFLRIPADAVSGPG
jgi:hypothetical protein